MESLQHCERCRSMTERTRFQPYGITQWPKAHHELDIYYPSNPHTAAVLQSELVSIMLASIVFLSPLCTISQLPCVVADIWARNIAATGIIWDVTSCTSALIIWVRVRTLKQHDQPLADSFAASLSSRPYWTWFTSPYSLLCSVSVSIIVILMSCIWKTSPDDLPNPSIPPRSPAELVILGSIALSAVVHLALVIRHVSQGNCQCNGDSADQTDNACCSRNALGEPKLSNDVGAGYITDPKP